MKLILIALALFATGLLFQLCKHQPKFSPDNLPVKQLRWGNGGGFTGRENTNVLLENGQLFSNKLSGEFKEAEEKAKSKTSAALFKSVQALNLGKMEFVHPGNLYQFIEFHDGDAVQRVVWGDASFPVDPAIQSLFDQLNGLLK
ncbi:MAG: hypothetical protein JNJ57_03710 [Saprospiraceae bacterium]|nr:hypothetical protein [Saprospiraceae bacterium]